MQQGVSLEHVCPRVNKLRVELVSHIGATTMARGQQPLGDQLLHGLAQRRTRHPHLKRHRSLGWQTVARFERAFKNSLFNVTGD